MQYLFHFKNSLLAAVLVMLLCCASTASFAQSKKQNDIKQLMELMYGDQMLESIIVAMTEAMSMDEGAMKQEVVDSIRVLMIENAGALQDSIAGVFERLYTAEEIKEMIKMYQTPIGKRLAETQTQLLQMSMAAGRGWAQSNAAELEARIKPVVEKYRAAKETSNFDDDFTDALAYDNSLPDVTNHPKNNKTVKGKVFSYSLKYNGSKWKPVDPKELNEEAEIGLMHLDDEVFSVIIAEEVDLSLPELRRGALINLRNAATRVDVKTNRLRKVNGVEVLELIIDCEINGIHATYHNFYFAGKKHVLQCSVFGETQVMQSRKADIEALLSGLLIK